MTRSIRPQGPPKKIGPLGTAASGEFRQSDPTRRIELRGLRAVFNCMPVMLAVICRVQINILFVSCTRQYKMCLCSAPVQGIVRNRYIYIYI